MTKEESYEVVDRMLESAFGDRKVINQFCEIIAEKIKDRLIRLLIEEGLEEFKCLNCENEENDANRN